MIKESIFKAVKKGIMTMLYQIENFYKGIKIIF